MADDKVATSEEDKQQRTLGVRARVFRCPGCDGRMSFDVWGGVLRCQSCGREVSPSSEDDASLIPYGTVTISQADDGDGRESLHAETDSDFFSQVEWAEGTDVPIQSSVMWCCPSCSASILTDISAVSSECPYCGSAMSVAEARMPVASSAGIVPFSVTGEEARAAIAEHLGSRPWLPSGFSDEATLEHAKPVYVPYYRYDVHADGWAMYPVTETAIRRGKGSTSYYHIVRRKAEMDFVGVPVDGSSKMPDAYMDALSPFRFDEAVPLSDAYLAGCLAEVPDEMPDELAAKAVDVATRSFDGAMHVSITKGQPIGTTKLRGETTAKVSSWSVTLVPIWVMHYAYEGKDVLVCVNGATGKCVSNLPVSSRKRRISRLLFVIPAVLVLGTLLSAFVSGAVSKGASGADWAELLPFLAFMTFSLGFGIIATVTEHDSTGDAIMDNSESLRYVGEYADERGFQVTEIIHSTEKFTSRLRAGEYADKMLAQQ